MFRAGHTFPSTKHNEDKLCTYKRRDTRAPSLELNASDGQTVIIHLPPDEGHNTPPLAILSAVVLIDLP